MNRSITHEKILSNLIYLYNKNERPLQASEVAQTTGLIVGTIRNHMQILKMLEMIKGITGPKGGYIPTQKAFKAFLSNNKSDLSVYLNSIKLEDVTISEIKPNPKDKSTYSGSITVIANIKNFNVGDTMTIQTSTNNYSIIKGTITGRDFFINTLYFSHIEVLTL